MRDYTRAFRLHHSASHHDHIAQIVVAPQLQRGAELLCMRLRRAHKKQAKNHDNFTAGFLSYP
jgi:hypothetical protein